MQRIRGVMDLVFDLVDETTDLVERTHDSVVERTKRRFASVEPAKSTAKVVTGVQMGIAGAVFKSIHTINGITRLSINAVADSTEARIEAATEPGQNQLATPLQSSAAGTASWCLDFAQSSINGLWGDYLLRQDNRLALGMTLRDNGRTLPVTPQALAAAIPEPTGKICIFVHSLAATEWLWSLSAQEYYDDPGVTFGTRLKQDLDYTPLYLRYNTGRHISENGRELAGLIGDILAAYPTAVEEIMLVGHSMGGLVVRSAAHYASIEGEPWVDQLRHIACIGGPHLGAPLEKAVNMLTRVLHRVDAAGAQVPAQILDSRSAGVKDLRYGYIVDEEWDGKDPDQVFADARRDVPLVDGVGYYFIAASISRDPKHPLGQLLGDLLVRLPSASGTASEPARRIPFTGGAVLPGKNHIHIANHPDVYAALKALLD